MLLRRMCPGRYTADASIWVGVVSILAAFNIKKARNETEEEIDFGPTFTHGITTAPHPFPCAITPRSLNNGVRELCVVDI
ncbi:hypothetical protein JVU11DRAFT_77 [Chiua virens]|nr:hypothetical protein JVU11DRAFT_77 [Chiua virens]